jgi:replication-associated recombination protein RarA
LNLTKKDDAAIGLININLYGGPGTGKSTSAAGLFYKMKTEGFKVELVSEFAKELTFSEDKTRLKDQLLILAEQHHRMFRLQGKVDYVIHDSPINMGQVYLNDTTIPAEEFKVFNNALFSRYDNLNIFLQRNVEEHEYQEYGRSQDLQGAIELDEQIKNMLVENSVEFHLVKMDENAVNKIYEIVKSL